MASPKLPKFIKQAWDQTFKPIDAKTSKNYYEICYKKDELARHYFWGLPKKDDSLVSKGFYVLGGFILKPLLSVVKLGTEFLLSAAAQGFHALAKGLRVDYPGYIKGQINGCNSDQRRSVTNYIEESTTPGKKILAGIVTAFWIIAENLRLLLRTITSPFTSFSAADKINTWLGVVSGIVSFVGILAISIFAPHYSATLLAKMGGAQIPVISTAANFISKGLSVIGNNSVIAAIAKPITKFFGAIGLGSSVTATTTGGSAIGIIVAMRALLSSLPEFCVNTYKSFAGKKKEIDFNRLKDSSDNLNNVYDQKENSEDDVNEEKTKTKKPFRTILFTNLPTDTQAEDYVSEAGNRNPAARYIALNNGTENIVYRRNKKEQNAFSMFFSSKMENATVKKIAENISTQLNLKDEKILSETSIFEQGNTIFTISHDIINKTRNPFDEKKITDIKIDMDDDEMDLSNYGIYGQ